MRKNFKDTDNCVKVGNSDFIYGGRAEARTPDPLIKSQLLYQLSYAPILLLISKISALIFSGIIKIRSEKMEREMGIEPTSSAWKAEALPLSYSRTLINKTS